jgi:hypothetical protein
MIIVIKRQNILLMFSCCYVVLLSFFSFSQKIEITDRGVLINSTIINDDLDIIRVLGKPNQIKEGYWDYNLNGITIYFTKKQNNKEYELSISAKNFKGELYLGKTRLELDCCIYKLLQIRDLYFKPIEIESFPNEQGNFFQSIDAICLGKNIRFVYFHPDSIGIITLSLF